MITYLQRDERSCKACNPWPWLVSSLRNHAPAVARATSDDAGTTQDTAPSSRKLDFSLVACSIKEQAARDQQEINKSHSGWMKQRLAARFTQGFQRIKGRGPWFRAFGSCPDTAHLVVGYGLICASDQEPICCRLSGGRPNPSTPDLTSRIPWPPVLEAWLPVPATCQDSRVKSLRLN